MYLMHDASAKSELEQLKTRRLAVDGATRVEKEGAERSVECWLYGLDDEDVDDCKGGGAEAEEE